MRRWSVRHARQLETLYGCFEALLRGLHPVFRRIGYRRLERPVAAVEGFVKRFLFDCRMCGDCLLSSTGMSCPMNCPKGLRNGPCGGVRSDGHCEVVPAMRCVWVEAWEGSRRMREGGRIHEVQATLDLRLAGRSCWLVAARDGRETAAGAGGGGAGGLAPEAAAGAPPGGRGASGPLRAARGDHRPSGPGPRTAA